MFPVPNLRRFPRREKRNQGVNEDHAADTTMLANRPGMASPQRGARSGSTGTRCTERARRSLAARGRGSFLLQ